MTHELFPVESAPSAPNNVRQEHIILPATDGYPLAATLYHPPQPAEHGAQSHVVVLNSGTGVKRQYYDKFAQFLAKEGFTVLTYDYRGIGESLRESLRNFDTSIHEWGEKDFTGVLAWIEERFGSVQLSVIGHSAGGKIVGFTPHNARIDALVTVCVPNSYWGNWFWWGRAGYWLATQVVMPGVSHALSYFPSRFLGLGEDYPKGVALEWARWCGYKEYILDPAGGHHPNTFHQFQGDVLAYSFEDDIIATGKAVNSLMHFYRNASSKTHEHIIPQHYGVSSVGHSGFFRESSKTLWHPMVYWLKQPRGKKH